MDLYDSSTYKIRIFTRYCHHPLPRVLRLREHHEESGLVLAEADGVLPDPVSQPSAVRLGVEVPRGLPVHVCRDHEPHSVVGKVLQARLRAVPLVHHQRKLSLPSSHPRILLTKSFIVAMSDIRNPRGDRNAPGHKRCWRDGREPGRGPFRGPLHG